MRYYYRFVDSVLRWLTDARHANTVDKLLMVWMTVMVLLCVRILFSVAF
jgi:hypothetical protein